MFDVTRQGAHEIKNDKKKIKQVRLCDFDETKIPNSENNIHYIPICNMKLHISNLKDFDLKPSVPSGQMHT